MAINKKKRELVYSKHDGHCGYCGKEIEYKEMQVDHIHPKSCPNQSMMAGIPHVDDILNLRPSCRRCNHYKRDLSVEVFRHQMKTLHERLAKPYINKVGLDYGIITIIPFNGVFYFEK